MKWYHYIAAFFAGMFLTNFVPHFIHGVSGDQFPSPFANPPGKGLSSPTTNVLWGLTNFVIGFVLLRTSRASLQNKIALVVIFLGILCMGLMLALAFGAK